MPGLYMMMMKDMQRGPKQNKNKTKKRNSDMLYQLVFTKYFFRKHLQKKSHKGISLKISSTAKDVQRVATN